MNSCGGLNRSSAVEIANAEPPWIWVFITKKADLWNVLLGGEMTPEDKQVVAEYMGWVYHETDDKKWWNIIGKDGATHLLDLNDAGLCVQKMVEKGDWERFYQDSMSDFAVMMCKGIAQQDFVAWLFNSDNFFTAIAAWVRSKV